MRCKYNTDETDSSGRRITFSFSCKPEFASIEKKLRADVKSVRADSRKSRDDRVRALGKLFDAAVQERENNKDKARGNTRRITTQPGMKAQRFHPEGEEPTSDERTANCDESAEKFEGDDGSEDDAASEEECGSDELSLRDYSNDEEDETDDAGCLKDKEYAAAENKTKQMINLDEDASAFPFLKLSDADMDKYFRHQIATALSAVDATKYAREAQTAEKTVVEEAKRQKTDNFANMTNTTTSPAIELSGILLAQRFQRWAFTDDMDIMNQCGLPEAKRLRNYGVLRVAQLKVDDFRCLKVTDAGAAKILDLAKRSLSCHDCLKHLVELLHTCRDILSGNSHDKK